MGERGGDATSSSKKQMMRRQLFASYSLPLSAFMISIPCQDTVKTASWTSTAPRLVKLQLPQDLTCVLHQPCERSNKTRNTNKAYQVVEACILQIEFCTVLPCCRDRIQQGVLAFGIRPKVARIRLDVHGNTHASGRHRRTTQSYFTLFLKLNIQNCTAPDIKNQCKLQKYQQES